jgi:hypothetical protein
LALTRTNHWSFGDETGKRRSNPVRQDQLLITLLDATGELVTARQAPMESLPPDQ